MGSSCRAETLREAATGPVAYATGPVAASRSVSARQDDPMTVVRVACGDRAADEPVPAVKS